MTDRPKWHEYEQDLFNMPPIHQPTHRIEQRQISSEEIGVETYDYCLDCKKDIL